MSKTTTRELRYAVLINHPSGPDACSLAGAFEELIDAEICAEECRRKRSHAVERVLGRFGYVVVKLREPVTVTVEWENG